MCHFAKFTDLHLWKAVVFNIVLVITFTCLKRLGNNIAALVTIVFIAWYKFGTATQGFATVFAKWCVLEVWPVADYSQWSRPAAVTCSVDTVVTATKAFWRRVCWVKIVALKMIHISLTVEIYFMKRRDLWYLMLVCITPLSSDYLHLT